MGQSDSTSVNFTLPFTQQDDVVMQLVLVIQEGGTGAVGTATLLADSSTSTGFHLHPDSTHFCEVLNCMRWTNAFSMSIIEKRLVCYR